MHRRPSLHGEATVLLELARLDAIVRVCAILSCQEVKPVGTASIRSIARYQWRASAAAITESRVRGTWDRRSWPVAEG